MTGRPDDGFDRLADIGRHVGVVELMKADNLARGVIDGLLNDKRPLRVGEVLVQNGGEGGEAVIRLDISKTDPHPFVLFHEFLECDGNKSRNVLGSRLGVLDGHFARIENSGGTWVVIVAAAFALIAFKTDVRSFRCFLQDIKRVNSM